MKHIYLLIFLFCLTVIVIGQETDTKVKTSPLKSGMVIRPNSREKAIVVSNNRHNITRLPIRRTQSFVVPKASSNIAKHGMVLRVNSRDKAIQAISNKHRLIQQKRKQDLVKRHKSQMQKKVQMQQRKRIIQSQIQRKKRMQKQIIRRKRQQSR